MAVNKTCYQCGRPLLDNQHVKNAYNCINAACGAKTQLLIIADMLEENEGMKWHADQIRKYCEWINGMEK